MAVRSASSSILATDMVPVSGDYLVTACGHRSGGASKCGVA